MVNSSNGPSLAVALSPQGPLGPLGRKLPLIQIVRMFTSFWLLVSSFLVIYLHMRWLNVVETWTSPALPKIAAQILQRCSQCRSERANRWWHLHCLGTKQQAMDSVKNQWELMPVTYWDSWYPYVDIIWILQPLISHNGRSSLVTIWWTMAQGPAISILSSKHGE